MSRIYIAEMTLCLFLDSKDWQFLFPAYWDIRSWNPSHFLFAQLVGPASRRKHQEPPFARAVKRPAARLEERREALVGKRDQLYIRLQRTTGDLALDNRPPSLVSRYLKPALPGFATRL